MHGCYDIIVTRFSSLDFFVTRLLQGSISTKIYCVSNSSRYSIVKFDAALYDIARDQTFSLVIPIFKILYGRHYVRKITYELCSIDCSFKSYSMAKIWLSDPAKCHFDPDLCGIEREDGPVLCGIAHDHDLELCRIAQDQHIFVYISTNS
jgi:hypothetical protein